MSVQSFSFFRLVYENLILGGNFTFLPRKANVHEKTSEE